MAELKRDVETAKRRPAKNIIQVPEFGLFGPEKLPPGRRIEKEILHLHRGALGAGHRPRGLIQGPAVAGKGKTAVDPGHPGPDFQPRDRTDARQGLSPEPQGRNVVKVVECRQFAGRVAGE